MTRKIFSCLLLICCAVLTATAQGRLTGTVRDAKTGEAVPYANVYYDENSAVHTDEDGHFALTLRAGARLYVSCIGYEPEVVRPKTATPIEVRLNPADYTLSEAVAKGKKDRYSRKDNPAVELMRKVIAAKKNSDLHQHDYASVQQYNKLTFALNNVTDKIFDEGKYKSMPFLKEHVEVCNETGRLILPISVDETVTRNIWRKDTKTEKQIILGQRTTGINELLNAGELLTTMLKDCFTEVNIYDDDVRLLQYPFPSPVSTRSAISFYHYFLGDTLDIDGRRCIAVNFTPANPQDFGFNGTLYVLADSTYRLLRAKMGIPKRSDVNFVERMDIDQYFEELPSGEQVLVRDNMIVQLHVTKGLGNMMAKRVTEYSQHSFVPIADKQFRFKGNKMTDPAALMQDDDFWVANRPESLTQSEDRMSDLVTRLQQMKGFKPVMWVAKAFIENFVETSVDPKRPSKVDIGPVNTMISQNFVDGLRLRLSAQTTANLNKHLFAKGYLAYGFKDHRWKGSGELTYSFNKKGYLPREFPVSNLTFNYTRDVMSPSDKFVPTDKDNVFTSLKWAKVDGMMYNESYRLYYDKEWNNGLRFKVQLHTEKSEPCGGLFYQPLSTGARTPDGEGQLATWQPVEVNDFAAPDFDRYRLRSIRTGDIAVSLIYQPGVTWVNTKQRRIASNNDAPIYMLSHTAGFKGVLSDYTYNITEASIYKRIWLGSWGKMDTQIKAGAQWNKVPFPLLCMPAANLSYIMEDNTFNLVYNMEFLNDRYASLMWSWDLNGKIFNRIPLLKHLKWREFLGVNVLWGTLTDKNNPMLAQNADSHDLFFFPGRFVDTEQGRVFQQTSHVMDPKRPYVELVAGIHNIFKLFHIEYVRRLNYNDHPDTHKWGIRFMFRVTF